MHEASAGLAVLVWPHIDAHTQAHKYSQQGAQRVRRSTLGTWDMEGKTICGIGPRSVHAHQMKETPVRPVGRT